MKVKTFIPFSLLLFACLGFNDDDDQNSDLENSILGLWNITAIHNSSPQGRTLGPGDGEVIEITFKDDGSFMGSTSVNSFGGSYRVMGDLLTISEFMTTEVSDTFYGVAFYGALDDSFNSTTNFNEFKLSLENDILTLNFNYCLFRFRN
ncbi:MAG: META domain-containing protein [Bacteroidota bacterium]